MDLSKVKSLINPFKNQEKAEKDEPTVRVNEEKKSTIMLRFPDGTQEPYSVGSNPEIDLEIGIELFKAKRFTEAKALLLSTVNASPQSAGHLALGAIYREEDNWEEAKQHWHKASDLGSAEAYVYLGNVAVTEKKSEEAISYYEKVPQTSPAYPQAAIQLGFLLMQTEKEARGLEYLHYAADVCRDHRSYLVLGIYYVRMGNRDKAIKYLMLLPDNPTALFELGRLYFFEHKFKRASSYLQKAALDHKHQEAFELLCTLYKLLGNDKMAKKYYRIAIEQSGTPHLYLPLAKTCIDTDERSAGKKYLRHAYETYNITEAALELGIAYYDDEEYELTKHYLHIVLEKLEETTTELESEMKAKALLYMGSLCHAQRDHELAKRHLHEAANNYNNAAACLVLAHIYSAENQKEKHELYRQKHREYEDADRKKNAKKNAEFAALFSGK